MGELRQFDVFFGSLMGGRLWEGCHNVDFGDFLMRVMCLRDYILLMKLNFLIKKLIKCRKVLEKFHKQHVLEIRGFLLSRFNFSFFKASRKSFPSLKNIFTRITKK